MNKFSRVISKSRNLAALGLASVTAAANAAVPATVTTAITEMQTDAVVIAGLVLVAIIAVMAVKFLRKGM